MTDPIFLTALTAFVVKNAPAWFASLGGTILDKSRDAAFDKSKDIVLARGDRLRQRLFHLDEKEQQRHLEQALKNATERGLAVYHSPRERDLYREIMQTLAQPGASGETLRHAMLQVFTLSAEPDLTALTNAYNNHQRLTNVTHQDIDAAPYLNSFFSALIGEFYADPYFRPQMSDVLQLRAAKNVQFSLLEVVGALQKIGEMLEDNYSAQEFASDISAYTAHIERTLHHLKIVGVVPKDQNADPELSGIFVHLRILLRDQTTSADPQQTSLAALLEQTHALVLLGGPGSGKSTATKYLAWSHVAANQTTLSPVQTQVPLLAGGPLPLRIELRLLNEERKRENYAFLSFAVRVLLKREGVEINPQMFKELLTRRGMVLIFDGLDEVGTLQERLGLVNEIEHFMLHYPGNRVLVTSRPVGYDLARFSHPLFSHADVQAFDDAQIQQFLENWYTSVLRFSPIPQRERDEINLLLDALKENPRLHRLAENPLLLTVMTALHRYERLPDRRVLVYDRCADLLLETWAKLKGTDKRWRDMRMIKDEQSACVAYLGLELHTRSQEETRDATVDVTARFLRKQVEAYLKQRELIDGLAERQAEAERFIALVQEEAGLIVERGTDENGEALYSFVHRTFQEYFAAIDIYERYQQKEDPKIISKFLREHLHDPHWREVIFLLLGKLKSTPVTNQLRQILQGKTKSIRSCYTQIVQQDLFFVCDCLVEEIKVENTLVELVIASLKQVVQTSWSRAQQRDALDYLGKLMKTRQYGEQGKKALLLFVKEDGGLKARERLTAIEALYFHSSTTSEERQLATQQMEALIQSPSLTVGEVSQTAESLYYRNRVVGAESQQLAVRLLMELLRRPDLTVEEVRQTAGSLYRGSPEGSEEKQMAARLLVGLVKRPDLTVEQMQQIAESLHDYSPEDSEEKRMAARLLVELVKRPDLTIKQVQQIAISLYRCSPEGSEAQQLATRRLMELLKYPDLTVEQVLRTADSLYYSSPKDSEEKQLATRRLIELLKYPNLTVEQMCQIADSLCQYNVAVSEEEQLAGSLLMELVKRPDLAVAQMWQIADSLYYSSPEGSEEEQLAARLLVELVNRPDLTVEQVRQTAEFLYKHSSELYKRSSNYSEEERLVARLLMELVKRSDLTVEQMRQTAVSLYNRSPEGSETQLLATTLLLKQLSYSGQTSNDQDVYPILRTMIPRFHKLQ